MGKKQRKKAKQRPSKRAAEERWRLSATFRGSGILPSSTAGKMVEEAANAFLTRLRGDRRPAALFAFVDDLHDWVEQQVGACHRSSPPARPIACAKGCSHCCRVQVCTFIPEVLSVARHLDCWSDERKAPVLEALRSNVAQRAGLDTLGRFRRFHPCAFLVDDACAIHPFRPLICRSATSFDAGHCARTYAEQPEAPVEITGYEEQRIVCNYAGWGVDAGAEELGLEHGLHWFFDVLERIFASGVEESSRAWLAGERQFADLQASDPREQQES